MNTPRRKTVSLVLGSGGARGLAHIGVIHELEANSFRIASISGCSMGALVGGVYAAGKLDELLHRCELLHDNALPLEVVTDAREQESIFLFTWLSRWSF